MDSTPQVDYVEQHRQKRLQKTETRYFVNVLVFAGERHEWRTTNQLIEQHPIDWLVDARKSTPSDKWPVILWWTAISATPEEIIKWQQFIF